MRYALGRVEEVDGTKHLRVSERISMQAIAGTR
jgi:hypothetical protein